MAIERCNRSSATRKQTKVAIGTVNHVDTLWKAVSEVQDPEFLVGIVDMGLVIGIEEHNGIVDLKLTFTAMGCPATDMIIDDVHKRLLTVPGVESVNIEVVWDPIWSSDRLSPTGRLALHEMGIAV